MSYPEVGTDERREDSNHGLVVEGVDGYHVVVTQEAGCDVVPAASRGSHGGQELNVL